MAMGMREIKIPKYIPGRQRWYVEVAPHRGGRPYVDRQINGEWEHTAPGSDETHPGCWRGCTLGACDTSGKVAA